MTEENYESNVCYEPPGAFCAHDGAIAFVESDARRQGAYGYGTFQYEIDFDNLQGERTFSALHAFGASKMMNLLFAFRLAKELGTGQQASMAFHPGLVKSDLLSDAPALLRGFFRLISARPAKAAQAIATLILDGNAAAQNGKFYNNQGKEIKAAASAYDQAVQQRLWKLSGDLLR